jgi:hypothetical protein
MHFIIHKLLLDSAFAWGDVSSELPIEVHGTENYRCTVTIYPDKTCKIFNISYRMYVDQKDSNHYMVWLDQLV